MREHCRGIPTVLATVGLACSANSAPAQVDQLAGSYLCIEEVAGGIKYDSRVSKWVPANFVADTKLLFTLTTAKITKAVNGQPVATYKVEVTKVGASDPPRACFGDNIDTSVTTYTEHMKCNYDMSDYRLNFETMRFLAIYAFGYIDGVDADGNTPSVSAGSCVKVK